jgi:hypothetical protein
MTLVTSLLAVPSREGLQDRTTAWSAGCPTCGVSLVLLQTRVTDLEGDKFKFITNLNHDDFKLLQLA